MNARQKAKKMKSKIAELQSLNRSLRLRLALAQANRPDVQLYKAAILITDFDVDTMLRVGINPNDEIRNKLSHEIQKAIKDKLIIKDRRIAKGETIHSTDLLIGFREK